MRRCLIICVWVLFGVVYSNLLHSQERSIQDSSLIVKERSAAQAQSITVEKKPVIVLDSLTFKHKEFKPNATKAILYSALLPGLGQIYNRKYWKLPIIYGSFVGLAYAISWNGGLYSSYSQAYYDLSTGTGNTWEDFLRPGETPTNISDARRTELAGQLKRRKDYFRRNRDLSIIAAIGVYALCMIDAYVDAHLYDFDISPDLSMRVEPVFWGPSQYLKTTVGLQCSISF